MELAPRFKANKVGETVNPLILEFVNSKLVDNVDIAKRSEGVLMRFSEELNLSNKLAAGIFHLGRKFNRIRRRDDLMWFMELFLWLSQNSTGEIINDNHLIYLANQDLSSKDFVNSVKESYSFWRKIYGQEIFEKSNDTPSSKNGIWKAKLPLSGYYMSLCGGSGSGTFSCDLAIGYEGDSGRNTELGGQIWRVGFDVESDNGTPIFRIIRTGSGQKHQGDKLLEDKNNLTRKNFLSEYKSSPQRLLLLLCMEIAYDLKFNRMLALSTEGAMSLSLLGKSKKPIDYTGSMTAAGFNATSGNWLKIDNLQENFYDILSHNGYEGALKPHEVRAYDMIIDSYNSLRHFSGKKLPHSIGMGDKEELEKALIAYKKLHTSKG